jgi:hypothetical protein
MSALARQSAEMGANLSREDLEAVAEAHDTDVETLLEDSDITLTNGTMESVSDRVVDCREAAIDGDATTEESDDGLLGGDGVDAGDVVNKSRDMVNESQQVLDDCSDGDG